MPFKKISFPILILLGISITANALAAITPEQEIQSQKMRDINRTLLRRIETPRKVPPVEEEKPAPVVIPETIEKILIKKIEVEGATLVSKGEIDAIILPFENKEYNLQGMQKIAEAITEAYRKKGYVTSRAYFPPQTIDQGVLHVQVLEGLTGTIDVKGNRYFKSSLFRDKIALKEGAFFDYNVLRSGLGKLNQQADRSVRAVLAPGKEPQKTDVTLEVTDHLPLHVGFDWDNLGSRYTGQQRFTTRLEDNNLLGLGDKLSFAYQVSGTTQYSLKSVSYLLPVSDWEFGFLTANSRVRLGRELKVNDIRGVSDYYSLFAKRALINTDRSEVSWHVGFDYNDITNTQLGTVTSADKLRVSKTGLDVDVTDNFGRTLLTYEMNYGIPGILGGMKLASKTTTASRSGAGGDFVKHTFDLLRLQKLPYSSVLLWKNQFQVSPYILPSAQQFQIGGEANVRGYPSAEAVGDTGYASTLEWLCPLYFLSKNLQVPFSQTKVYDAVKFALFYDWAEAHLRRPSTTFGEKKDKTLRSAGCGLRFNLPNNDTSFKIDFAWPLANRSSDGSGVQILAQFSITF